MISLIILYNYIYICIGYSPGWRQLWAYNTREIIGQGHSPRQLSQGCYMPITAIKSHLTHCCQVETIVLSQLVFTVKTVKIQLDDLVARH